MRHLPLLNALRVFEVAARTGSYPQAEAELGLTHGAVSRQIAALETWLGQRLFVRGGRHMDKSPAMARLLDWLAAEGQANQRWTPAGKQS